MKKIESPGERLFLVGTVSIFGSVLLNIYTNLYYSHFFLRCNFHDNVWIMSVNAPDYVLMYLCMCEYLRV